MAGTLYLRRETTVNGVIEIKHATMADDANDAIYDLNIKQLKSYMNVSGTVVLLAGGALITTHHVKVDGNATIDFVNIPENSTIYLLLEQDSTGGFTITLPTFDNLDAQPVVQTVADKMDVLTIMKIGGKLRLYSYIRPTSTF